MTAQEVCKEIGERIGPRLQDLGVEAFVLVGYVTDGEGKISKINVGLPGVNPAYADGLRSMERAAAMWGQGQL